MNRKTLFGFYGKVKKNRVVNAIALLTLLLACGLTLYRWSLPWYPSVTEVFRPLFNNAPLLFVSFAVMGLYLGTDPVENRSYELLESQKNGLVYYYFSSFLRLLIFSVLISLVLTGLSVGWMFRYPETRILFEHTQSAVYFARLIVTYLFGISVFGTAVGLAASLWRRRLIGFLFILIVLLGFYAFREFPALILQEFFGLKLHFLSELVNVFPNGLDIISPPALGIPLLLDQVSGLVFWILFFLSWIPLALFRSNQRKAKTATLLPMVGLMTVCLAVHFWPASRVYFSDLTPDYGLNEDYGYYIRGAAEEKNADVEWEIAGIEMDLSIFRRLKADVLIKTDRAVQGTIPFTLYHGFRVNSVTDLLGNALSFTQDGDYITVQSDSAVDGVRFAYAGSSNLYYSNEQAISLPGSFPWYPHPGHHPVYDKEWMGFLSFAMKKPVPVSVKANTVQQIHTNLEETESGKWEGTTTGVTIVGGMIAEEQWGDVTLVYPYLDTETTSQESRQRFFERQNDPARALPPEVRKIIVISPIGSGTPGERLSFFSDHVALQNLMEYDDFAHQVQVPSYKWSVYNAFKQYREQRDSFDLRVSMLKQAAEEFEPDIEVMYNHPYYRLDELMKKGEAEVIAACEAYLQDPDDTRSSNQFLTEMEARYR